VETAKYKGCNYCKNFTFEGTCLAFAPDPIPLDIISGETRHILPILGQSNSIVYEYSEKSIFQKRLEIEETV
jgi:O-acetyl-ADP-ribose deacetylase